MLDCFWLVSFWIMTQKLIFINESLGLSLGCFPTCLISPVYFNPHCATWPATLIQSQHLFFIPTLVKIPAGLWILLPEFLSLPESPAFPYLSIYRLFSSLLKPIIECLKQEGRTEVHHHTVHKRLPQQGRLCSRFLCWLLKNMKEIPV